MTDPLLFFDCETTGLPRTRQWPRTKQDARDWPHVVQLAWAYFGGSGEREDGRCRVVRPDGFVIPEESSRIHGISHERALAEGDGLEETLDEFLEAALRPSVVLVAHNLEFDLNVIRTEMLRLDRAPGTIAELAARRGVCTMKCSTDVCRIQRPGSYGYKWPTLLELHRHLHGRDYEHAHDAASDLEACIACFFKLRDGGLFADL